jgi:Flp pilus assembly pilin Flp
MRRKGSGQNLIEVLIILGLVSVAAIFALTIFGGEINTMFSKSHDNVKGFDPFNTKGTVAAAPAPTPPAVPATPASPASVVTYGSYDVNLYPDGSASFVVEGQDVMLPAALVNLQDTVFETTGAASLQKLVPEIAYMVESNKAAYPSSNVPINIMYGDGQRIDAGYSSTYEGTAVANAVVIQVGNDIVILQNDQNCTTSSYNGCSYEGQYKIEGTLGPGNYFSGYVSTDGVPYSPHGNISGTIDQSGGGFEINNANFQLESSAAYGTTTYYWDLDFNTGNNFSV